MTFTENVMRRLFEKSPELKDTTFCGRTLIAKVDSQIIVKMTMVSTEKDNHLNAVSCVIMNRYGPLDRHLFRFSELVGDERGRKLAVAEYDVGVNNAGGVYLPDPFTFEDISAISVPILGYVSKFYSAYYDDKYRPRDAGEGKEGNG